MKNGGRALLLSLLVHGLIAAGIVAYMDFAPAPETAATLDLSSVELSFAEKEDDTSAVQPLPAVAPARAKPPRPPELPPPDRMDVPRETPEAPSLPLPEPEPVQTLSAPALPVPTAAPRQAHVEAAPRPKRTIRPDYPQGARQRGEQGDVQLEISVGADGAVEAVRVIVSSGFQELDDAALKALKAARFTPAQAGGRSVASKARLTLSFKLK